jgi:hypothetical protein
MPEQCIIPTVSFDLILAQYRESLEWLDHLEVDYRQGRIQKYLRTFEDWNQKYKTATALEAEESFPSFIYSVQEIWDIISIYSAFNAVPASDLKGIITKLKEGVKGPVNLADETSKSTRARNFVFEALMAAKAHNPSRQCCAILDANTDTGILFDGSNIWIECKRITTLKKIEKNVREASKQLQTAISKQVGANHRGIVSVDVSKILNKGDQIFTARNSKLLLKEVKLMMDRFIADNSHIWQGIFKSKSTKILGIIIKFDFMTSSEEEGLVSRCTQWGINPRNSISKHDSDLLQKLVAVLKDNN